MSAAVTAASPGRAGARTLFVLWATYGSFYFCRVNFGPTVPTLRRALGFTALEIGLVLGVLKLGYAVGQLVNGQLTERFGPRRILGFGMLGSAGVTLLLSIAPPLSEAPVLGPVVSTIARHGSAIAGGLGFTVHANPVLALMLLLVFANGWFQACGWPPCVKVAASWFPVRHRARMMGILGTSYTLGSFVAIPFVGLLLQLFHGAWQVAFVAPAIVLAASFAHMALRLEEAPPVDARQGEGGAGTAAPVRMPIRDALGATLGNPRIWVLAFGLFGLDAVRYGFLDWAPGHLAEVHGTGALPAALKTMVFPLAGALGTLSSGWMTDRFFQSRRAPVCALMLFGVGGLTLAYRVVVGVGVLPTVICLALTGYCLFGAQILLVGTAAQDFAKRGATAAAAGFVDFSGHMGAFSGDVVTGWMRERYGWGGAIGWWASAAFAGGLIVTALWRVKPRAAQAG